MHIYIHSNRRRPLYFSTSKSQLGGPWRSDKGSSVYPRTKLLFSPGGRDFFVRKDKYRYAASGAMCPRPKPRRKLSIMRACVCVGVGVRERGRQRESVGEAGLTARLDDPSRPVRGSVCSDENPISSAPEFLFLNYIMTPSLAPIQGHLGYCDGTWLVPILLCRVNEARGRPRSPGRRLGSDYRWPKAGVGILPVHRLRHSRRTGSMA